MQIYMDILFKQYLVMAKETTITVLGQCFCYMCAAFHQVHDIYILLCEFHVSTFIYLWFGRDPHLVIAAILLLP